MDRPRTLGGLQDKGTSAENLIDIGRRPMGSARPSRSGWASGETIPALAERALELETQLASIQADLEKERRRLASYSDFDVTLNDAAASAYRKADTIRSRAQSEANANLERAISERRLLQKEVDRLRQERDELQEEIATLRRGELAVMPIAVERDAVLPAPDLQTALAEEMRVMLAALLEEVRARPSAAPTATVAPPEPPPPPREIESVDVFAETAEPIVDEDVAQLHAPERLTPPSSELVTDVVSAAPPKRVFDEYVEEFTEPEIAEPVVDEDVADLRAPEPPPSSALETDVVSVLPPERTFDEYVEEFAEPQIGEPVVDEYVEELRRTEQPPDPATPAPSANIEALWETAASPSTPVEPPPAALPPLEPASFITDEFIAATRPGSAQESDVEAALLPPSIDVPPLIETEVPSQVADVPALPPFTEPAPHEGVPSSEPAISEERGVRQIQVLVSPVHSFPRLIEIKGRIQSLSSVQALQLRDFRNGVATFAVAVAEAISPQEFGAVIQMLEDLHLRLEGTGQNSVELRAEGDVSRP